MLQTEPTYIENKDRTKTEISPNPYLWLSHNKQDVYYQDGEYYRGKDEEPIACKDVPKWFWSDLKKCYSLEIIDRWGIVLPENQVKTIEEIQRIANVKRKKTRAKNVAKKSKVVEETVTV